MKLVARGRYACLAMIAIARRHQDGLQISAPEIAKNHNLSPTFLAQVLRDLRRAGLVHSQRGMFGGYSLSMPAESISLGDILRSVVGLSQAPDKEQTLTEPALASVLEQIHEVERAVLGQTTLAQLVTDEPPHVWVI
jgi:Rrf2 family transcriptional regulator, cysteine metabolism repressor